MNTITIERGAEEEIRATPREYKGNQYIDLRLWFKDHPTRKGVVFTTAEWECLTDLIKEGINV